MQDQQNDVGIRRQQLAYLQQRIRQGALFNLAASALLTLLLTSQVALGQLGWWFVALILTNGLRLLLARHLDAGGEPSGIKQQFIVMSVSAGLVGFVWGNGAWLLSSESPITAQTQLVIALAGMLAAGAFSHAAYMPATVAYVASMYLPMLLWINSHWSGLQLEFQTLLLVYVAAILVFSRNHSQQLLSALRLATENTALVGQLKQEVDSRRQLETTAREAESQLRSLIEQAPDGILLVGENGDIVLANSEAHRLFGYEEHTLLGKKIEELVPRDVRHRHAALRDGYLDRPHRQYVNTGRQLMGLRRDGSQFPAEIALSVTQTDKGPLTYASVRDLSLHKYLEQLEYEMQERRKAEEALQKLYREQAAILNATQDQIAHLTLDGRLLWWNRAVEDSLGLKREALEKAPLTRFFDDAEQNAVASTIADTLQHGSASIEANLLTRDGPRLFEFNTVLLRDVQNHPVGIVSVGRDISEKRENERLVAEAQHIARLAHWRWDNQTGECSCSDEAYVIYGRPSYAGGLTRKIMLDAVLPDDRERVRQALVELERPGGKVKIDHRITWADGSIHWLHLEAKGVHGDAGQLLEIRGTVQEITERKAMEQTLRESERRLALAIKGGNHGIWDWDLQTNEVYFSERWKEMLGCRDDELPNVFASWQDNVHPEDLPHALQQVQAHLDGLTERFEVEFRMRHKDGHYVHLLSRGQVFHDDSGHPQRFSGIHVDISERRRAELVEQGHRRLYQLLAGNASLEEMLQALVRLVVTVDPGSRSAILLLNEAGTQLNHTASHGLPDFFNQAVDGIAIGPDTCSSGIAAYSGRNVITEDLLTIPFWQQHHDLIDRAGLRSCWSQPILDSSGKVLGAFSVYHDAPRSPNEADLALLDDAAHLASIAIERHRMQSATLDLQIQLQQAQKMEAIGHLAGGIAHDFNNILATIMGFTDLSLTSMEAGRQDKLPGYLQQVSVAAARARDLVRQLLTFSRIQKGSPSKVNLGELLNEVGTLLRPTLPSSMDLSVESADISTVIDPVQLHQVLMNLSLNARDAMNGQGRLSIRLYEEDISQLSCSACHEKASGHFIVISVVDDGPGISPAMIDRMFEPFASTKDVGKGSGMGLAITHGIIHEHGGHIVVDSSPGHTEFKLLLPKLDDATDSVGQEPAVTPEPPPADNGHEHVLLVDDEQGITGVLSELLGMEGYRVTTFNSSTEALAYFRQYPDEVDLLITDQTMPGLSGSEMSKAMLAIRPDLPVMLCTGFSDQINEEAARAIGIRAFLLKPIKNRDLLQQARKLLADPDNTPRIASA